MSARKLFLSLILNHRKGNQRTCERQAKRSQHDQTKTEDKRFVDRLFQRKPRPLVSAKSIG
jgi:hypothetical protein